MAKVTKARIPEKTVPLVEDPLVRGPKLSPSAAKAGGKNEAGEGAVGTTAGEGAVETTAGQSMSQLLSDKETLLVGTSLGVTRGATGGKVTESILAAAVTRKGSESLDFSIQAIGTAS